MSKKNLRAYHQILGRIIICVGLAIICRVVMSDHSGEGGDIFVIFTHLFACAGLIAYAMYLCGKL